MSANTIERQLFDWDGWDQVDTFALQFYNVVLKVPIGEFEVGHKFENAVFCGETSALQLLEDYDSDIYHEFELKISIGNKIV
jgi:hypothetical protein